tara:strand:- start:36 stop:620 length:585 start_codon:yes stop_codon:yes gene_type:complete
MIVLSFLNLLLFSWTGSANSLISEFDHLESLLSDQIINEKNQMFRSVKAYEVAKMKEQKLSSFFLQSSHSKYALSPQINDKEKIRQHYLNQMILENKVDLEKKRLEKRKSEERLRELQGQSVALEWISEQSLYFNYDWNTFRVQEFIDSHPGEIKQDLYFLENCLKENPEFVEIEKIILLIKKEQEQRVLEFLK